MPRRSSVPLAVLGALLLAAPAAHATGFPQVTNFSTPGAEAVYTVPLSTTSVHIDAIGGMSYSQHGANVSGDYAVTPGEHLYVEVAGTISSDGAWNGGGAGGDYYASGGGGASDVRLISGQADVMDPTSLASRILVAGGAGGRASYNNEGGAGGLVAAAGFGPSPGQPGTLMGPGLGGGDGHPGVGAQGGAGTASSLSVSGGGGGGGYFGGGGGGSDESGGGAGSSYVSPDVANGAIGTETGYAGGHVAISAGLPAVAYEGAPDFGDHQRLGTVAAHWLTLVDHGAGPFIVTGEMTVTGPDADDFLLGQSTCDDWTVSCRVAVFFAPTDTGARSATLTVPTDDPAGPLAIPLSGTSVVDTPNAPDAPDAPAAVASVAPAAAVAATPAPAAATPVTPAAKAATPMVLATCHPGLLHRHAALRCRIVNVPAGATLPGGHLQIATLVNRNANYGSGTARVSKDVTQLLLTPARHIAPGRYSTLTLKRGKTVVKTAVVIG
ncbi:glycine-rich protein [Baekduia sp.]|jgi:hypothetical protein|uniref:glycine-rich protein n=1 Tax=Baekduia sp. TaxID=2600305 RepID=UPI002E00D624|nr:glycine-rich protein [Baekduia sp.]